VFLSTVYQKIANSAKKKRFVA